MKKTAAVNKVKEPVQDPRPPVEEPVKDETNAPLRYEEGLSIPMPVVTQEEYEAQRAKGQSRFHGDPTHAQYLLADPERKNEAIKYAAEHGYHSFIDAGEVPTGFGTSNFDDLPEVAKFGLYSHVASIIANPHAESYPALMPANSDRKAYRALDDALRDALGFARFTHK